MKPDVRGVLARLGKDARLAAADRYREALASGSSDVRLYLAAAATLDHLVRIKQAAASVPRTGQDVGDAASALAWRLRSRTSLVLERAAIGGADDLSLSLSGRDCDCAAVRGISLTPLDGGDGVTVPALVRAAGGSVRVVATMPSECFSGRLRQWRVSVTTDTAAQPVAASRAAIPNRWGAEQPRPLRLGVDGHRQLTIAGRLDVTPGIEHELLLGLTTALVTWRGAAAELRCTADGGSGAVTITGQRDPAGTCTATIDLMPLTDRPPADWDVTALDAAGAWQHLALPPGDYPPSPIDHEVLLRRSTGATVRGRLGYRRGNRLTIQIGGRA